MCYYTSGKGRCREVARAAIWALAGGVVEMYGREMCGKPAWRQPKPDLRQLVGETGAGERQKVDRGGEELPLSPAGGAEIGRAGSGAGISACERAPERADAAAGPDQLMPAESPRAGRDGAIGPAGAQIAGRGGRAREDYDARGATGCGFGARRKSSGRLVGYLEALDLYAAAHQVAEGLIGRPVAVVRDGAVVDVSPEAAADGARRGVRVGELRWLCPDAICVQFDSNAYRQLSQALWSCVYEFVPAIEIVDFASGFFDATGCIHGGEAPRQWLQRLVNALRGRLESLLGHAAARASAPARRLAELPCARIEVRAGLAPTKPLAQIASRAGVVHLAADRVGEFLSKAPIEWLPAAAEVKEALKALGVRRIGEIARIPADVLHARLGWQAGQVVEVARGGGPWRVQPNFPPPAISARFGPLESPSFEQIEAHIRAACRRLWAELQRQGMAATRLRLRVEPLFGPARQAERDLPGAALGEVGLLAAVEAMWRKLWDGEDVAEAVIELCDLQPRAAEQFDLWGRGVEAAERHRRLMAALQALSERFGAGAVVLARELPPARRFAERVLELQLADCSA